MIGSIGTAALVSRIPPDVRAGLRAAAEVVQGADLVGPPPLPRLWRALFDAASREFGSVVGSLLPALAWVLARYRPDAVGEKRAGIVGCPVGPGETAAAYVATVDELGARDVDAWGRVERAVSLGAGRLAGLIERDGLVRGLYQYVEAGEGGDLVDAPEMRELVGRILGVWLIEHAKAIPSDIADQVCELCS